MKYETPKLRTLTPAINAIKTDDDGLPRVTGTFHDGGIPYQEHISGYMAWED